MTVGTGHGGMKRNKAGMAAGQDIKPRSEESSGKKRAMARKKAAPSSAQQEAARTPTTEAQPKSGWEQIGKAGGEIAGEYMRRRKEKKAASTTG